MLVDNQFEPNIATVDGGSKRKYYPNLDETQEDFNHDPVIKIPYS